MDTCCRAPWKAEMRCSMLRLIASGLAPCQAPPPALRARSAPTVAQAAWAGDQAFRPFCYYQCHSRARIEHDTPVLLDVLPGQFEQTASALPL